MKKFLFLIVGLVALNFVTSSYSPAPVKKTGAITPVYFEWITSLSKDDPDAYINRGTTNPFITNGNHTTFVGVRVDDSNQLNGDALTEEAAADIAAGDPFATGNLYVEITASELYAVME